MTTNNSETKNKKDESTNNVLFVIDVSENTLVWLYVEFAENQKEAISSVKEG